MKKIYVLASALLVSAGAFAQGHELFFSEYNEGAHPSGSVNPANNITSAGREKAMEVFNPTTSNVNLAPYSIARYSNGATAVFQEEALQRNVGTPVPPNTLNSGDVYVIANQQATLTDITNVWDQKASAYDNASGGTMYPGVITRGGPIEQSGNDAMVLKRYFSGTAGQGPGVIVDIFGVIGHDPGNPGWNASGMDPFGNPYNVRSANQSLVRKSHIENGTTVNPVSTSYDISQEWETFSAWNGDANQAGWYGQSYANLGVHTFTGTLGAYNVSSVLEKFTNAVNMYPNPAQNDVTIEVTDAKVASIVVFNNLGQRIFVQPTDFRDGKVRVDISKLKSGLYFVQFVSADNTIKIYKELIVN